MRYQAAAEGATTQEKLASAGPFVTTTRAADLAPRWTGSGGYTQIGKRWWRTAINTESKLLLLRHAFDTLGCERVEWHADVRTVRSCAAIERLGATREGDVRRHRLRKDGSWRDTAQFSMTAPDWLAARDRLVKRLAQGDQ